MPVLFSFFPNLDDSLLIAACLCQNKYTEKKRNCRIIQMGNCVYMNEYLNTF